MKIVVILLIVAFFALKFATREEKKTYIYNPERSRLERLVVILDSLEVRFPRIYVCQMILETGSFTSAVFRENRNVCGMKHNGRGYSLGANRDHAKYSRIAMSVEDYRVWQEQRLKLRPDVDTEEEYLQMLDSLPLPYQGARYAVDTAYTTKLRRLRKIYFQ